MTTARSYPKVATRERWLAARKELLAREKAIARERDAVNAQRRRLPMVLVDKDYVFTGPRGEVRLLDMFEDTSQLYIHHVRRGNAVYHTYSAYARGMDHLSLPYSFLDLTPYGRQEDWEDSPPGWPQRPTYG
jgi:predicted dithiol-disulfide oxidoreductase (DUF899 family)